MKYFIVLTLLGFVAGAACEESTLVNYHTIMTFINPCNTNATYPALNYKNESECAACASSSMDILCMVQYSKFLEFYSLISQCGHGRPKRQLSNSLEGLKGLIQITSFIISNFYKQKQVETATIHRNIVEEWSNDLKSIHTGKENIAEFLKLGSVTHSEGWQILENQLPQSILQLSRSIAKIAYNTVNMRNLLKACTSGLVDTKALADLTGVSSYADIDPKHTTLRGFWVGSNRDLYLDFTAEIPIVINDLKYNDFTLYMYVVISASLGMVVSGFFLICCCCCSFTGGRVNNAIDSIDHYSRGNVAINDRESSWR